MSNSAETTGRDIIDDIVVGNQSRNQSLFNDVKELPPYFGCVNIGEKKTTLTPIRNRAKLGRYKLICDIVEGVRNFQMNTGKARVCLVTDGVISKETEVHPELIKLIKTCVVCSYSGNEDYTLCVSEFVHKLASSPDHIIMPLALPDANKTQKIVSAELNEFLKELCDKNDIKYYSIVEQTPKKAKRNPMVTSVNKSGGKG